MPATTRSTVVSVFRNDSDAQSAAAELKASGFTDQDPFIYSAALNNTTAGKSYREEYREGGVTGWFKSLFGHENDEDRSRYEDAVGRGHVVLSVETNDENADAVAHVLERFHPVDVHRENVNETVNTSPVNVPGKPAANANPGYSVTSADSGQQSIPVVAEELKVGKRRVLRGGVRVYSRVIEEPVQESVRLQEQHVRVDRQSVDRPVAKSDLRTGRDQVIEVQEYAEEPVVSKQARVVEEIRIERDQTERTEVINDTLSRTEVRVENLDAANAPATGSKTEFGDDYRRDFAANYANTGATYEDYAPSYLYGYDMANDPRYRGRNFDEVEPDLRAEYGRRYPNGAWDRFKNSVRYGWDRVTGKAKSAAAR